MLSGDIVGNRESTRDCLDRCDAGPLCLFFYLVTLLTFLAKIALWRQLNLIECQLLTEVNVNYK